MESPPMPENFWAKDFSITEYFAVEHRFLNRSYSVLKKHLHKRDAMILSLVQKYVDLQYRLSKMEQLEIEKETLMESRTLLNKVGLSSIDPMPVIVLFENEFRSYIANKELFTQLLEAVGFKRRSKKPPALYSPPSR
jgi:hypothetical protein